MLDLVFGLGGSPFLLPQAGEWVKRMEHPVPTPPEATRGRWGWGALGMTWLTWVNQPRSDKLSSGEN